jgi:hypothetical protein
MSQLDYCATGWSVVVGYANFEDEPLGRQGAMAMAGAACSQPLVRGQRGPTCCTTDELGA